MEAYSEIVPGEKLSGIIDLPEALRNCDVEVIVLPTQRTKNRLQEPRTLRLEDFPRHRMGREKRAVNRENIYDEER